MANGVSGNTVVGTYDSSGTENGFIWNGSTYQSLEYPGAAVTEPIGILGSDIVGTYSTSSSSAQGFFYNGTTYTTLDDPLGTDGTVVTGVSGTTVVGYYYDSSEKRHGFIASIAVVPEPSIPLLLVIGGITLVRRRCLR